MNVLNKIKSKRNKESSELSQHPPAQVKVQSILTQQKQPVAVLPVITKSVHVVQRQSIMRPASQRSKSDTNEDLDEATVTQYFLKKDRQNKKARKNLSQSGQIIKEEQLKSSVTINVKKGYSLGSVSIFQGEAVTKQEGKQQKRRKMTFSCGSQTIQFPQGISKIFLTKITFISEDQAIFIGEDIIKVSEKGYAKK